MSSVRGWDEYFQVSRERNTWTTTGIRRGEGEAGRTLDSFVNFEVRVALEAAHFRRGADELRRDVKIVLLEHVAVGPLVLDLLALGRARAVHAPRLEGLGGGPLQREAARAHVPFGGDVGVAFDGL